jgi:hypothetical protein
MSDADDRGKARRERGFLRAAGLVQGQVREAGESRGFAAGRLLTHWAEIAGPEFAETARPVKVSYAQGGFGGTLTVLVPGALAPMLEMQKEKLRERVNAVYGYNAIARIRLTQTAAEGFAEGKAQFAPAPRPDRAAPGPALVARAHDAAREVADPGLRDALEALGRNVLSRSKQ